MKDGEEVLVEIKGGKVEKKIICNVFFHDNSDIDVAVLASKDEIVPFESLPLRKRDSYYLAQECLFLGFPLFNLGTHTEIGKVAFIKKAIISAFHEEKNVNLMLLDGHNNPGFSGGPVITYSETMDKQFIIGVISAYINQPQNVSISNGLINSQFQINENSGIIISYTSDYILDIIKKIEQD